MKTSFLLLLFIGFNRLGSAQAVTQIYGKSEDNSLMPSCGSHHFMKQVDRHSQGYLAQADKFMEKAVQLASQQSRKKRDETISIPVVFHVLYQDSTENIPDSVLKNQLDILNQAFAHSHPDTDNVRDEFKDRVGIANIQFKMAEFDPDGKPTTGVVRQATNISHFGGLLPYGPGQNSEIQQWVTDSFYYNLFRITRSDQGGSDEWDPYTYLNIWIGDMRIFEPKFNDFEELVFVGLATPPQNHQNWPIEFLPEGINATGVLLHHVSVGANNANPYPAPYGALNKTVKQGKIAIHEVGHYLGLRHIWGDGTDCTADDFIDDTPLSRNQSNFACSMQKNTCIDSSDGPDLPDMIENYMDYSSGLCATAFTQQQVALMRIVYKNYRQWPASAPNEFSQEILEVFPNPSSGQFFIKNKGGEFISMQITDLSGKLFTRKIIPANSDVALELPAGIYLIETRHSKGTQINKLIIQP